MVEYKKKHVAVVCPGFGGSGAVANVVLQQTTELSKVVRVSIISDSFPENGKGNTEFFDISPYSFSWLRRFSHVPREYVFSKVAERVLKQLHHVNPIDLIMCHGHAVAALAAKTMKDSAGVPYVLVTHGDIFDRPDGTYDSWLTWFYKKVTPVAYINADLVVALSPFMKEMAIRGGADFASVEVIPNGINPEEIGLCSASVTPSFYTERIGIKLLFVGRLSVEKGVDILINACDLLKRRDVEFQLIIVGDGPEKWNITEKIRVLDLKNMIKLIGQVRRSELSRLYRSANVVCVPSLSDPLPTVVLEAMAASVAVVGSDTGGIPFMIDPDITGQVFPVGDSITLAEILELLANDIGLVREMGKAGKQRVTEKFSWEKVCLDLFQAMDKIWCGGK